VYTGYRVPLIVISPWTKNVVSHTAADYTSILKLIEKRFGLAALTKRDAIQPDMSEFFDFDKVPLGNGTAATEAGKDESLLRELLTVKGGGDRSCRA
jgi:phospholipase C